MNLWFLLYIYGIELGNAESLETHAPLETRHEHSVHVQHPPHDHPESIVKNKRLRRKNIFKKWSVSENI